MHAAGANWRKNAAMNVLICNAGSSSLKFSLFQHKDETVLAEGAIDWSGGRATIAIHRPTCDAIQRAVSARGYSDASDLVLRELRLIGAEAAKGSLGIDAIGHRVVHGGVRYSTAVLLTPEVEHDIEGLSELAPLHNPPGLEVIRAMRRALPGVPQVAAFDTAFHSTLPPAAFTYAVPRAWTREWGLRRFGFHGLSHAYCARRAAETLGRRPQRLIIAHLGNGASISAVRDGVCIDTSMGFTPMEGVMMGTRSGTVDPGILIYVLRERGMTADSLDRVLNQESGLLGVSGVSSDMRRVLQACGDSPDARLAIDIYVHRVRQTIGAMAATLGGADALVFTAGIGEHAPLIRERICETLGHLGLELDNAANVAGTPDCDVAASGSRGRILVITTREDLMILRELGALIGSPLGVGR